MSLSSLLTQRVWILPHSSGADDEYGNPTDSYGDAVLVSGRIEQRAAREETADRDTPVSDWVLYLHPDTQIGSFDRVQDADGRMFEVVGTPNVQRAPRGAHHIEAQLRNIESDLAAAVTGAALTGSD